MTSLNRSVATQILVILILLSYCPWAVVAAGSPAPASAAEADQSLDQLLSAVRPFVASVVGRDEQFRITGTVELLIDGKNQSIEINMARYNDHCFDLTLTHADYAVALHRRQAVTVLAMPRHGRVFIGRGDVAAEDRLSPAGLLSRLTSTGSQVSLAAPMARMLAAGDIDSVLKTVLPNMGMVFEAEQNRWKAGNAGVITTSQPGQLSVTGDKFKLSLIHAADAGSMPGVDEWPHMQVTEIDRDELERTLLRGVRRATEILAPSKLLTDPVQEARTVSHGRLIWRDGQRIALLKGTPQEIGTAHGQLLPEEAGRCIESVLYTFGTVNVIRTGRWFRHDLQDAYARLSSHIPERHKQETRALAAALQLDPATVEALNVFPELFHCSGFAVFGSATKDGRLYHGRVLDYMTTIGLQDAATTFIVEAKGQLPFANVGYAGFVGSVSGMNAEGISLGEMGGRGEGQWDGAPMATLMRRAMEECRTLDEVKSLWTNSPRTCEYYYVFADGKTNQAVGVAATPESIEFVDPGQSHELLGEGIADAVVLSAGSRLKELRRRVTEKHGQIDADLGMWLMSRPVAMESNLHNVLFIPADGILYVANASHKKPAAEMAYVRINLKEMLQTISQWPITAEATGPAAQPQQNTAAAAAAVDRATTPGVSPKQVSIASPPEN